MNTKIFTLVLCLIVGTAVFASPKLEGRVKKTTPLTPTQEQELTLGIVQKDVKIGSTQDEVATALGSPNIVTKDSDGKDTWIYDKVSSISSYDEKGFGIGLIVVGYAKAKGSVQNTQKTLTVVIKFDKTNKVESFTYHMSKF